MEAPDEERPGDLSPAAALGRLPTGAKVFLILSGALLPLAVIAFFATLQTRQTADQEVRARLNVAAHESARALAVELGGDMSVLRAAEQVLEQDPDDSSGCAKAEGLFAQGADSGARYAVRDPRGKLLCGSDLEVAAAAPTAANQIAARLVDGQGLTLQLLGAKGGTATAFFPVEVLRGISKPTGFVSTFGATLRQDSEALALQVLPPSGPLDRREKTQIDLGLDGLKLEMSVRSAPITSPLIIALLLPLLMWIAAAGIGWFVVDGLLIRPLRRLRSSALAFKPGEVIDPKRFGHLPAEEIRELGDTFRHISRMVQIHEQDLAEGLARQTKLTREVHHRVKNNLQVIGSLINFHARGAKSREASEAYAAIQRRVDALAVVHRYHYAELEENRGVELRSVIGELGSNLRATAPESASGLGLTLEIEPFLVSQDVAVAVAFLITELVELAISINPGAQIGISVKADQEPLRAVLRVSSSALVETPELERLVETRYGRVIGGLVRQLRSRLHHDPLVGAYETAIAVVGRD